MSDWIKVASYHFCCTFGSYRSYSPRFHEVVSGAKPMLPVLCSEGQKAISSQRRVTLAKGAN
jgi:hypothetical protein